MNYRAILLKESEVDALWQSIARAEEEEIDEIFSAHEEMESSGLIEEIDDIKASWSALSPENAKIRLAEVDQELLSYLSPMVYSPEYGKNFAWTISLFAEAVGISEIDAEGGGEDLVSTEQWINGFKTFLADKQEALKEKLGKENTESWKEFGLNLKPVRDIAKFCNEKGEKMIVFSVGDAVLMPYFAKRADQIYETLQKAWG